MVAPMCVLSYELNPFGGAVIDPVSLPDNPGVFTRTLDAVIKELNSRNIKVVWLTLPLPLASLVPVAAQRGFVYHHAEPEYLHMTLTLIPGSIIPPYATHYIGAGGVVLDGDNRLLVVSERYHLRSKRHYKLPGGALEQGEHIAEAVVREVLEETGIRTEFLYTACFRHWHGYRYDKSDIYFVCRLKALSFEIIPDSREIFECLWMPVEEFLNSPDTHAFNRRIVRAAMTGKGLFPEEIEGYGTSETHEMMFC